MKIHFELNSDGYADISADMVKAMNIVIDNLPAFMMKLKALKDFVETIAKSEAEKRSHADPEAAPETPDEPAAPAEHDSPVEEAPEVPTEPDAAA